MGLLYTKCCVYIQVLQMIFDLKDLVAFPSVLCENVHIVDCTEYCSLLTN